MGKFKARPQKPSYVLFGWFQDSALVRAGEVAGTPGVAVYSALCFYQMRQMNEEWFYASYNNLSAVSRLSSRSVIRVVKMLKKGGLIEIREGGKMGQNLANIPNRYRLGLMTVSHKPYENETCLNVTVIKEYSPVREREYSFGEKKRAEGSADAPLEAGAARQRDVEEKAREAGLSVVDYLLGLSEK